MAWFRTLAGSWSESGKEGAPQRAAGSVVLENSPETAQNPSVRSQHSSLAPPLGPWRPPALLGARRVRRGQMTACTESPVTCTCARAHKHSRLWGHSLQWTQIKELSGHVKRADHRQGGVPGLG